MISIHALSGIVTLSLLETTPESLPRPGDKHFTLDLRTKKLTIDRHSFWVTADEWKSFRNNAEKLLKSLKGTAAFRSMSPGGMILALDPSRNSRTLKLTINTNSLGLGSSSFPKVAIHFEDEIEAEWLTDLGNSLRATA
jgi:hypothetical protein